MRRPLAPVLKLGWLALLSLSALPKCSGNTSMKEADTTACVPGRQVQCECADGTTSNQLCDDAGSRYLPCACAAAGAAGGEPGQFAGSHSGGSGTTSGMAGGGMFSCGRGGASDADGGASDGGRSEGGSSDGGGPLEDDPCPVGGKVFNCSDTCENPVQCRVSRCTEAPDYDSIYIDEVPAVVRTPAIPGDQNCGTCTPDGPSAVANITLRAAIEGSYKIQVDSPWYVIPAALQAPNTLCIGRQCVWRGLSVLIATTDPNAPARNVYITEAPPDSCP
jgi:hypothetical protein